MAIKGYQGSPVYNQKIGIVRASRGGEAIGQAVTRSAERTVQRELQKGVERETRKGEEQARTMRTRDPETGELSYQKMPEGMSPVAQRTAEDLYRKRYVQHLTIDLDNRGKELATQYKYDPKSFADNYRQHINTVISEDPQVAAEAERLGEYYLGEYLQGVRINLAKKNEEIAYDHGFKLIQDNINDVQTDIKALRMEGGIYNREENIFEKMSSSELEFAEKTAKEGLIKNVEEFALEFAHKLEAGWLTKTRDKIGLDIAYSRVEVAQSRLSDMVEAKFDPASPSRHMPVNRAASVALSIQQSLADGIMPTNNDSKRILNELGIDQKYLSSLDREQRQNIASKVSNYQGSLVEQHTAGKLKSRVEDLGRRVDDNLPLGAEDVKDYFEYSGIDSAAKFNEVFEAIMNPQNDQHRRLGAVIKNATSFPPAVKQFLSPENFNQLIARAPNSQRMAEMVVDFYEQSTQVTTANGTVFTGKNLSENSIAQLEVLKAVHKSVNPTNIVDYIANRSQPASQELIKMRSTAAFGEKTMAEYFTKEFDIGPEDRVKFQRASELWNAHIGRFDEETTKNIIEQTLDKTLYKSEFFNQYQGAHSMAPERVYQGQDLELFKKQAQANISLINPNFVLGDNAFLLPVETSNRAYPNYIVVNEMNMPVMAGSTPLMIYSSSVEQSRKSRLGAEYEAAVTQANKQFDKRLKTEKFLDEDAEGLYSP